MYSPYPAWVRKPQLRKGYSPSNTKRGALLMVTIRSVELDDLPVVAEMMHDALDPFYGGDHRAHAKRIVETAAHGTVDTKGHFSAAQLMYVAQEVRIGLVPDERDTRFWLGIYGFETEYAPEHAQAILADLDAVVAVEDESEL